MGGVNLEAPFIKMGSNHISGDVYSHFGGEILCPSL